MAFGLDQLGNGCATNLCSIDFCGFPTPTPTFSSRPLLMYGTVENLFYSWNTRDGEYRVLETILTAVIHPYVPLRLVLDSFQIKCRVFTNAGLRINGRWGQMGMTSLKFLRFDYFVKNFKIWKTFSVRKCKDLFPKNVLEIGRM